MSVEKNPDRVARRLRDHGFGIRLVDGTPSYRAQCRVSLTPENAEKLIPQQTLFTVRADPNDHSRIAISLTEQIANDHDR